MDVLVAGFGTALAGTGGSNDAIVVSHTHTATVTDPGHFHVQNYGGGSTSPAGLTAPSGTPIGVSTSNTNTAFTGISVTNSPTGSSATGANLQPYIVVYMWNRTA